MTDSIKKFMEMVSTSEDIKEKFIRITKEFGEEKDQIREIIALAASIGIDIKEEDFTNKDNYELDDDELIEVAGGRIVNSIGVSDCMCTFGGGGTGDDYQKTCVCVIGGAGYWTDEGKKKFKGDSAMICVSIGFSVKNAVTLY